MAESTGRLSESVVDEARRIVFGENADYAIDAELMPSTQVDLAHVVMLTEQELVSRETGARLSAAILELREAGFAALRGRVAARGLYLLYESYLVEQLGISDGGALQTARSRNDVNATVVRLRLRDATMQLLQQVLALSAQVLEVAERHQSTIMPLYTHYQAALPITYGHYLLGIATALERDTRYVQAAIDGLRECPLGAGAGGGTSLAIRAERTSELLGFDQPCLHSIDAVASRDFVLHILSAASVLQVTLSRLATDLLTWLTSEYSFLGLPDSLVGSSSMMPQKRNPFLLEHVQGRGAAAIGALAQAFAAMQAKPFTNAIAVGTEAVSGVWLALQRVSESATLARLVLQGAQPDEARMLHAAEAGFTTATELANLMVARGSSFREAHTKVGAMVTEAVRKRESSLAQATAGEAHHDLSAAAVVGRTRYGGGPSGETTDSILRTLRAAQLDHEARSSERLQVWSASYARLLSTARALRMG